MIEFTRTSNTSIELKFDAAGLHSLIDAMRSVLARTTTTIEASFDMPIVTMKRSSPKKLLSLSVMLEAETTLAKREESVVWSLDAEDAESALTQLQNCQSIGFFSPSEFLRVQSRKNKNMDWIYGEMVSGGDHL